MTQLPPPTSPPNAYSPGGGLNYGRPDQPPQSNAWAIVSLVCGILGCLVVTPFAAIVTGIIGLTKVRRQGGQAMAIIGLVLGVLWLVGGLVVGVGGFAIYKNAAALIANSAKPQTIALINRLGSGNTARDPTIAALSDSDIRAIADTAGRLGPCKDISLNRTALNNTNGNVSITFGGTATFDKGTAAIDASMRLEKGPAGSPPTMLYDKLELK